MSITRRILQPAILFFAAAMAVLIGIFTLQSTQSLTEQERSKLWSVYRSFDAKVEALQSLSLGLATNEANIPEVEEAFAAQDRERLIELTHPSFVAIKDTFHIVDNQFHLPPAISFMRVNELRRYGDDLSSFRRTVVVANQTQQPVSGLEVGRNGLSVRGVAPISLAGRYIGSVEFGLDVDQAVLEDLKLQADDDWHLLLNKESIETATLEGSRSWVLGPTPDLFVQASTQDAPIYAPASAYEAALAGDTIISNVSRGARQYAILSAPLNDFSGKTIGVVNVVSDRTENAVAARNRVLLAAGALVLSLLVGGMVLSLITSRALSPIRLLTDKASAVAAGDLGGEVMVSRQDELGTLAKAFNSMTGQLRELIGQLEQRVSSRTAELEQTAADLAARSSELEVAYQRQAEVNQQLGEAINQGQRRAALLQASIEVNRAITQVRDLDTMLPLVTQLISQHFNIYHAGIFLVDEQRRYAVLRAANSEGGQQMLARGHRLPVGSKSMVGHATATGEPRISLDVDADAVHRAASELPHTRSEAALPLRLGGEVIGALDVQSTEEDAFGAEDLATLTVLADQIAIAIQNAMLFQQTQVAMSQAEDVQQRYMQQAWTRYLRPGQVSGYEYCTQGVAPLGEARLPEIELAMRQGEPVSAGGTGPQAALAVPIRLRNQTIGAVGLHEESAERQWSEDEIALVEDVAEQIALALENARLFEQSERRAQREALISQIVTEVRKSDNVDGIMQTAVRELGRVLGARRAFVHLEGPNVARRVTASEDGDDRS